jgi:hypothetical protein
MEFSNSTRRKKMDVQEKNLGSNLTTANVIGTARKLQVNSVGNKFKFVPPLKNPSFRYSRIPYEHLHSQYKAPPYPNSCSKNL